MKDLEKEIVVRVEWKDAISREVSGVEYDTLLNTKNGEDVLATNYTYGRLVRDDKYVVILVTEESTTEERNITIIPRGWIKKISHYYP